MIISVPDRERNRDNFPRDEAQITIPDLLVRQFREFFIGFGYFGQLLLVYETTGDS